MTRSVDWLIGVQNQDGGWGMYEHHPSRIVTTAEAVTGLAIAGVEDKSIDLGIDYLVKSAEQKDWCQYTRHHAWTVYALIRAGCGERVPPRCIHALERTNEDGGWSQGPNVKPTVFATFLGWRALNAYGQSENLTSRARRWLADEAKGAYWVFADGKPSYAATSYAILALSAGASWQEEYGLQIKNSIEFLLGDSESLWPIEQEESVSGDFQYNFHHFTLAWCVMALLSGGVSVFNPMVRTALDRLYHEHFSPTTGGWSEEANHRPSVFGTSHVLAALEVSYNSMTLQSYLLTFEKGQKLMEPEARNNVFIVHGHDDAAKQEMARFLEHIGCMPIILEEQVDAGITTIFQKFTEHANRARYAIVLLSLDDMAEDRSGLRAARARQNVIMELGFFIAKLGPSRVCLAKKGSVEIPTDISGILYLNLDDGGWKLSLAKKLKLAGLSIDSSNLL
ncbi:MAG TPA: TIR domain-containing protein [Pyrinomonadaceae bacterium]|nr:TIR domain-containing protein [Pyrinomonadaceae bacterium]